MSVQQPESLWQAVLGELQLHVTRPSYETWLKETTGLNIGDDFLVIGTPNPFVAEMLEQRMYSLISRTLDRVSGKAMEIKFTVTETAALSHSLDEQADDDPTDRDLGEVSGLNGNHLNENHKGSVLNHRYTFDTFIVGRSNELAHAAAEAVADKPGLTYNPLFIYSGVGLGKTHLLHAIGQQVKAKGMALIFSTTEEFTNEYIKAIREGKTEDFRNYYRSADVLLLDDIQFLIGKEQTQEGFFHTFNTLHMAARQIVVTSDRPVTELTLLEDRVRSRLAGGLIVDIQPPDLETRLAILRARAEEAGQQFPPEVLEFLAERIHQNIRELEGCMTRAAAFAQLVGRPITLDLVKRAIADTLNSPNRKRVTDVAIVEAVSSYFGVDVDVLKGRRRDKHTALVRQVAMFLMREDANLPLSAVGRALGGKDHTTVMHACQRISSQINIDSHLRRDITNLREAILAP